MPDIFETSTKGIFFDTITHKFFVWVKGRKKTSVNKNNLLKYVHNNI